MFVDQIRVYAEAGDGGRGAVSFRRAKFVPRGGPDGGDGGRGGSVILRASDQVDNLVSFYYDPKIKAKSGNGGGGRQRSGRSAEDRIALIPVGTVVYRVPESLIPVPRTGFEEDDEDVEKKPAQKKSFSTENLEMVADLTDVGQEFILCQGGKGGKGNMNYKTSTNRVPMEYTEGTEGERGYYYFELRKIADAGLVGYPNAGKSTLISQISAAHPKIAAYPFTTLTPMIGVVDLETTGRFTVADIPGLIEGAHLNVGLGHDFLRHVVRCKLLLFVIDMAGSEGRHPSEDLSRLREEVVLYDPTLARRDWLVVANKMDLPEAAENLRLFRVRFPKVEILEVSADKSLGIEELKQRLGELILH